MTTDSLPTISINRERRFLNSLFFVLIPNRYTILIYGVIGGISYNFKNLPTNYYLCSKYTNGIQYLPYSYIGQSIGVLVWSYFMSIIINPNNKKEEYFNIADCIDFIFLKYAKLFSLDNEPFIAEIDLKMKEDYSKYANDFRFIWDESLLKYNYTLLNNTIISIDQSNLKLGIFEIKVQILFKSTLIETLKGKSNIIIYKVKL